jgi:hypothetical protein
MIYAFPIAARRELAELALGHQFLCEAPFNYLVHLIKPLDF